MTTFLTDGRTFLGPYADDEIRARARGHHWLREVEGADKVFYITAETEAEARRVFRKIKH